MRQQRETGPGGRPLKLPAVLESTTRLLERARSGDEVALDHLYRRYLRPLQGWARGRLPGWARDLMDTDDLVQESLVRSLGQVERFEPERSGAFQAYLRQSIMNRMRDEVRRARRRPPAEQSAGSVPDCRASPIEEAIDRETRQRYQAALDSLPEVEREGVVARLELGLGWSEIASIMGKSSSDAARVSVARALVKLAREMAEEPLA